jgi:hypothetical protein
LLALTRLLLPGLLVRRLTAAALLPAALTGLLLLLTRTRVVLLVRVLVGICHVLISLLRLNGGMCSNQFNAGSHDGVAGT